MINLMQGDCLERMKEIEPDAQPLPDWIPTPEQVANFDHMKKTQKYKMERLEATVGTLTIAARERTAEADEARA